MSSLSPRTLDALCSNGNTSHNCGFRLLAAVLSKLSETLLSPLILGVCEFFNSPAVGWNKRRAVPVIRMVIDMSSAGTARRSFQPTKNAQSLRV